MKYYKRCYLFTTILILIHICPLSCRCPLTLSDVATPDNKGYRRKTWSHGWKCTLKKKWSQNGSTLLKRSHFFHPVEPFRLHFFLSVYGVAQSDFWWRENMSTGSHFEFEFLYKPILYGVARLLYGVATLDSVPLSL